MLQQGDIDTLLAALTASQHSEADNSARVYDEVKIYDFARPDNLPSEFMRALDNINAMFARALSGILTGYLSQSVQVDALSIDQMSYRQFCNSVPEITAIATFTISPLEGTSLIELNPHLAWFLIDRGLGGKGELLDKFREFTPLEKGLFDDLFRRVLRELGRCWEPLAPMRPVLREVLSNPTIARIAQPDDRMVVCSFSINLPGMTGVSTYCIPTSGLDFERLLDAENDWVPRDEALDARNDLANLSDQLLHLELPLKACMRDLILPVGDLSSLSEGDILMLETRVDEPIEIRVSAKRCFLAHPVTVNEKIAVELVVDYLEDDNG